MKMADLLPMKVYPFTSSLFEVCDLFSAEFKGENLRHDHLCFKRK